MGLTAEGEAFERLAVDEHTVLLIDESSLAGAMKLARTLDLAQRSGASVRLLGDPGQLGAVEAGGALRLIADQAGAAHLEEVHRFATPGRARSDDRPGTVTPGSGGPALRWALVCQTRGRHRRSELFTRRFCPACKHPDGCGGENCARVWRASL